LHPEAAHHEAGEVSDARRTVAYLGDHRLRTLRLRHESHPLAGLKNETVVEGVELQPIDAVRVEPLKLQHRLAPSLQVGQRCAVDNRGRSLTS